MGYNYDILQALHDGEYFDNVPPPFVGIASEFAGEESVGFDLGDLEAIEAELSNA